MRRLLLRALALLLLLGLAFPAWAARRSLSYRLPPDALESFSFSADHLVKTELLTLPPEAEPYDTDALGASLAEVRTKLSGRIQRVVGRVFRDSSLGLVSRVVDLSGTVDRGDGAVAVDWSGIEGKSVSMRVLSSGELLASSGWQHLAGAGRGGDMVQDVLLQSVLRLPFMLPEGGGAMPSSFRMRVPLEDPLVNLDQAWTLFFEAAPAPAGCKRCQAISYQGSVTETAEDRHPARPMRRDSAGTVSGTIVLDKRGFLQDHQWTLRWERDTASLRENGLPRASLHQTQEITGRVTNEVVR